MKTCVFCAIANNGARANLVCEWDDAIAFTPLNPVVEGHVLVVPKVHVVDAREDPRITGIVFGRAAELIGAQDANLIANVGPMAGQTVFHLHVHIVPRSVRDQLCMPWECSKE